AGIIMTIFTSIVQTTYADNGIVVNATNDGKVVSFDVTSGNDSPGIHNFIITIHDGQYSRITESPPGWMAGIIDYKAVMWTTKTQPIEPGSTEDSFAMEVSRPGEYTITWSVSDSTLHPYAWGTLTVTI
ncbi:MAG: hypothetical protein ACE5KA_09005, partial [Nitrososphaerales archaeon]